VLLLKAKRGEDAVHHILRALAPKDATKAAFDDMVKEANLDTLTPVFKAAIEAHRSQVVAKAKGDKSSEPAASGDGWVPTVIIELDRNLQPDDVAEVCRVAKLLACEEKVAAVVLVLSDAGTTGIPPDISRQSFLWLGDFSQEEADAFLDALEMQGGSRVTPEERLEVYSRVGTRAAMLADLVDLVSLPAATERKGTPADWLCDRMAVDVETQVINFLKPVLDPASHSARVLLLQDLMDGKTVTHKRVDLALNAFMKNNNAHAVVFNRDTGRWQFATPIHRQAVAAAMAEAKAAEEAAARAAEEAAVAKAQVAREKALQLARAKSWRYWLYGREPTLPKDVSA